MQKSKIAALLKSGVAVHIYFWGFIFALFVAENPLDSEHLKHGSIYIGSSLFPVYYHLYLFNRFFMQRRYLAYLAFFLPVLILYSIADQRVFSYLFVTEKEMTVAGFVLFNVTLILLSTALMVIRKGVRQEMSLQELKTKQVQTELDYLKAQINPHFLFNTLNNLFSLARKQKDSGTADGIARLSHLMRYMIFDSNVDRISLAKEVKQNESFIDLQKRRFDKGDDIDIEFNVCGPVDTTEIAPMILMPFVENAFKHSVSLQNPVRIRIDLAASDGALHMTVENSVNLLRQNDGNDSSKIGLANAGRRLELLYPGKHELKITRGENRFQIDLHIKT